jgi:hypothetical protein
MNPTLSSTRLKIVLIAVLIAVAKEVAAQFGVIVSAETFYGIETMLLSLAGLDTLRPLGMGKPETPAPVADNPPVEKPVGE